jgi:hypothetical protein
MKPSWEPEPTGLDSAAAAVKDDSAIEDPSQTDENVISQKNKQID